MILYKEKEVTIKEYGYDYNLIKDTINTYLKINPLQEKWGNTTYSREVICTGVSKGGFTGEDLQLSLMYTDQGDCKEDNYIDEDLPYCKKFKDFIKELSKALPDNVKLYIPYYYYSK